MFFISAAIYAFGAIFYGFFGSGQLQPWAMPPDALRGIEVDVEVSTVEEEKKHTDTVQDCIRNPVICLQTDNSTEDHGDASIV